MAESSGPWDGVSVGDAVNAPYDAPSEFAQYFMALAGAFLVETNKSGVIHEEPTNSYNATGGVNSASIDSGKALTYGTVHVHSGPTAVTIPTPAGATRIDRIVLRKDWAAQTIRITRIAGVEGGGVPALTQNAGVTWDQPLWQASITTGGVITLTDERQFLFTYRVRCVAANTGAPAGVTSPYVAEFDQTLYEYASSMHDTGIVDQRINIPIAGVYKLVFTGNATGTTGTALSVTFRKNGVTAIGSENKSINATNDTGLTTVGYARLAWGDYVEVVLTFAPTSAGTFTFADMRFEVELVGTP